MLKTNKVVDTLEDLIERIKLRIENLDDKKQEIYERTWDRPSRENTKREIEMIEDIDDEIDELEEELYALENALDYLTDYIDWD